MLFGMPNNIYVHIQVRLMDHNRSNTIQSKWCIFGKPANHEPQSNQKIYVIWPVWKHCEYKALHSLEKSLTWIGIKYS